MPTLLLIVLLLFLNQICPESNSEPKLISLGHNCYGAAQIRRHGYRTAAYPFDWLVTPLTSLNDVLKHNFENFLDKQHLILKRPFIINKLYDIYFMHDFFPLAKWRKQLSTIQKKYLRRIQRFQDLANCPTKIYFIRIIYAVTSNTPQIFYPEEALLLKQQLHKQFPNTNFELVLIFYGLENNYDWTNAGIRNFYIHERNPPYWTEPDAPFINEQFCKIFESLGCQKKSQRSNLCW